MAYFEEPHTVDIGINFYLLLRNGLAYKKVLVKSLQCLVIGLAPGVNILILFVS